VRELFIYLCIDLYLDSPYKTVAEKEKENKENS